MKTILVLDDSRVYRHALVQLFKKLNFNVLDADNGLTGKELFQKHSIDLAFIDIVMPKLDGFALCRWVKANPKTQQIPIIFCSSKDQATDKYWAFKQGGDYFMSKPMTATDIIRAVETYLPSPIPLHPKGLTHKPQKKMLHQRTSDPAIKHPLSSI